VGDLVTNAKTLYTDAVLPHACCYHRLAGFLVPSGFNSIINNNI
jgi:hypothetical protein